MAGWILIFDEDVRTRLPIARVFAQRGFVVIETANAADIFECAKRLDLACVFLAIDSPGADGITLLSLLRESHPTLPIVIMADYGSGRIARDGRLHGAHCCLQRPISCAVIEGLVAEMFPSQDHAAEWAL